MSLVNLQSEFLGFFVENFYGKHRLHLTIIMKSPNLLCECDVFVRPSGGGIHFFRGGNPLSAEKMTGNPNFRYFDHCLHIHMYNNSHEKPMKCFTYEITYEKPMKYFTYEIKAMK